MKVFLISILSVLLITFLTSCSAITETNTQQWNQQALDARNKYLNVTQGMALCEVTADYGERVYSFSLTTEFTREEDGLHSTLQVTAPEEIAGIKVTQMGDSGKNTHLLWEDMMIETGDLAGISPITALPMLLTDLQKGYIYQSKVEEMFSPQGTRNILELFIKDPDSPLGTGVESIIWLDSQSYLLLGGEIYQDGARVLTCAVTEFTYS